MTKRTRFLIVALTMLVALLVGQLVQRRAERRVGARARIDTGLGVDGRVPIDPHGAPLDDRGDETLRLAATKVGATPTSWDIEVEAIANTDLAPVEVQVSRFDTGGALEPGWTQVVWTGNLTANQAARFELQMPLGPEAPLRVQVTARHAGDPKRRISTTTIVR